MFRSAATLCVLVFASLAGCGGGGGGGGGSPPPVRHDLVVQFSDPNFLGTVTLSPSGTPCYSGCTFSQNEGTVVTMTAVPWPDTRFDHWSGACSGSATCTVTMAANQTVVAHFTMPLPAAPANVQVAAGPFVSWDPGIAEGRFYTQYFIYLALAPGVTPSNYASLAGGERRGPAGTVPVHLPGLLAGRRYYLVVTSGNFTGEGPPSAEISFMSEGTPPDPHFIWQYDTGCLIYYSSPALGPDGSIYFGTGGLLTEAGKEYGVFALNPDGSLKWKNLTGITMFTPAVGSDGLYVQDQRSGLRKLSLDTGATLWSFPLNATWNVGQASPAIDDPVEGVVYAVADDIYAINASDGTLKWLYSPPIPTSSVLRSSPAVASDGTIYVGLHGGGVGSASLLALRRDGTEKWRTTLPLMALVHSSPAIAADGTIYVGAETETTSALFAVGADGTVLWQHDIQVGAGAIRSSPAIGADGTVYVGVKSGATIPGQLIALDSLDGALRWSFDVGGIGADIYSSPTVGADGLVYVGAETGSLYALDAAGVLAWSFYSGNGIDWPGPALAPDGTLYVGNNNGTLFALQTTSLGLASSPWPRFRRNSAGTGH